MGKSRHVSRKSVDPRQHCWKIARAHHSRSEFKLALECFEKLITKWKCVDLNGEERDVFFHSSKNALSVMHESKEVSDEIERFTGLILRLVNEFLLPLASTPQATVLYLILEAECQRALKKNDQAVICYDKATDVSIERKVRASDPVLLELAISASEFYSEFDLGKAIAIGEKAKEAARDDLYVPRDRHSPLRKLTDIIENWKNQKVEGGSQLHAWSVLPFTAAQADEAAARADEAAARAEAAADRAEAALAGVQEVMAGGNVSGAGR